MKTVNIHEAKTHLSRLVDEAASGEVVVIAKAGKPMVRLVPLGSRDTPRQLGLLAGQVAESDDCWAQDDVIERMFAAEEEESDPGRTERK